MRVIAPNRLKGGSISDSDQDVQMVIKLPKSLREGLRNASKANDRNSSQVIRELIRKYIAQHGQDSLKL